ncbi:hypothetical protein N665_1003s0005 [Sinapis alba]|nr:hypothetical protein N665_1003s0005 [Sinapis alba]
METNLQRLSQCLLDTLSPDSELRQAAEALLLDAAGLPEYGLTVLRLVGDSSDDQTRHVASVAFKNHLRSRWLSDGISPIADSEKEKIKTCIVSLMESYSLSPLIKSQLSEAMIVIGQKDYLKSWPTFLSSLISQLKVATLAHDYATINGILGTADSVFKKFRQKYMTDDQLLDLKYCHDTFSEPLIIMFKSTDSLFQTTGTSSSNTMVNLKPLIESQKLCCCICLSLSFQVLPEYFKNNMRSLMLPLASYLQPFANPELVEVVNDLRCAVIAFIDLSIEKHEKYFEGYVSEFVRLIFPLVQDSRHEIATSAIKYLTTVSTSSHHYLFGDDTAIKTICLEAVIPNVFLRVEEEELFDMNYMEFIRRDIEPSGVDNRRRMASELLKGLATNYASQVVCVVLLELQRLHSSFLENRAALWRNEVCVIDLVISVGDISPGDFVQMAFKKIILSELHSFDNGSYPMLKARCLKFLAMFSANVQKPVGIELFMDLARLLQAESNVVHSYAASCIEKLLLVKEEGGKSRYVARDIDEVLIMRNLFDALKLLESEENPFVMKCITCVLSVSEMSGDDAATSYIVGLTAVLKEICKLPKNSVFNQHVFESIALLLRRAYERDIPPTSAFEIILFPRVKMILDRKLADFMPYALQLMAQFIELNNASSDYIMDICLVHDLDSKNLAGLVRLIQTVLPLAPENFNHTEKQGFCLLCIVFKELRPTRIDMEHVLTVLFQLFQANKTIRFQKTLLLFFSLVVVIKGQGYLEESLNSLQENLFFDFLDAVWIPSLISIMDWENREKKLAAVAATNVLGNLKYHQSLQSGRRWGKLLNSIISLVLCDEKSAYEIEVIEDVGDRENYLIIHKAIKKEDHVEGIKDPKELLVYTVSQLSRLVHPPSVLQNIIAENLNQSNKVNWVQLCTNYKARCGF